MFSITNFDPNIFFIEQILLKEEVPIIELSGSSDKELISGCQALLKITTSYHYFK